jgi:hypothetical protein
MLMRYLGGGVGHCSNKPTEAFADEEDEMVVEEDGCEYTEVMEGSADDCAGATTGMDEDATPEYDEEEEEVDSESDDESSNDSSSDHSDDRDLGPEDGEEDGDDEDNHDPYDNF